MTIGTGMLGGGGRTLITRLGGGGRSTNLELYDDTDDTDDTDETYNPNN